MLIKTDACGASWLLPIGFKFPKPNFRLSQEFSGTKSTIEKNVALSMSFVGTLPFVWGHCKGMKSYRTTVTCALIAYSPLFSWHTSSARGEGRTKAVNKVGQNCELCGGFLLAGELLSSLLIRFVVSRMRVNWAVSLQYLRFGGSLRLCYELCSTYFPACQTICMSDSIWAVKEFKIILLT